jgi:hypothetical protein
VAYHLEDGREGRLATSSQICFFWLESINASVSLGVRRCLLEELLCWWDMLRLCLRAKGSAMLLG